LLKILCKPTAYTGGIFFSEQEYNFRICLMLGMCSLRNLYLVAVSLAHTLL